MSLGGQHATQRSAVFDPHTVAKHEYDERTLALVGFERAWQSELRREVEMSREELVEYLMTHSERISAIRDGPETESEQRRLLGKGIDSFYIDARTRMLAFGIQIDAFRRQLTTSGMGSRP